MPCIFGFGFHDWFCPCQLVNAKMSDLDELLCSKCKSKFRSEYKTFLSDEKVKSNWDGNLEDFLYVHIESRLSVTEMSLDDIYECGLSENQCDEVSKKFYTMYNNFMDSEERRFEAKVASGEIPPEDLIN